MRLNCTVLIAIQPSALGEMSWLKGRAITGFQQEVKCVSGATKRVFLELASGSLFGII